jgi:hypothetical protein
MAPTSFELTVSAIDGPVVSDSVLTIGALWEQTEWHIMAKVVHAGFNPHGVLLVRTGEASVKAVNDPEAIRDDILKAMDAGTLGPLPASPDIA